MDASSAPRRSTNRAVFSRYSVCTSKADSSRPFASLTFRVHDVSWLISRIARIGFSSVRSRITVLPSTIRSTRSVIPTFMKVVHSLMFESPTIT